MEHSRTTNAQNLEQQREILESRQKAVRGEFIQAELDLAITFCQIALSSGDREKIERNEAHAQEAHESALKFLGTTQTADAVKKELEEKLEHLQNLLEEIKKRPKSARNRVL